MVCLQPMPAKNLPSGIECWMAAPFALGLIGTYCLGGYWLARRLDRGAPANGPCRLQVSHIGSPARSPSSDTRWGLYVRLGSIALCQNIREDRGAWALASIALGAAAVVALRAWALAWALAPIALGAAAAALVALLRRVPAPAYHLSPSPGTPHHPPKAYFRWPARLSASHAEATANIEFAGEAFWHMIFGCMCRP